MYIEPFSRRGLLGNNRIGGLVTLGETLDDDALADKTITAGNQRRQKNTPLRLVKEGSF